LNVDFLVFLVSLVFLVFLVSLVSLKKHISRSEDQWGAYQVISKKGGGSIFTFSSSWFISSVSSVWFLWFFWFV